MTRLSLRNHLRRQNRRTTDRGQGMTEYIIIVALIAIAAIGVVTVFGQDIRALFATSTSALSGKEDATSGARAAGSKYTKAKNLKEFGKDNKGF